MNICEPLLPVAHVTLARELLKRLPPDAIIAGGFPAHLLIAGSRNALWTPHIYVGDLDVFANESGGNVGTRAAVEVATNHIRRRHHALATQLDVASATNGESIADWVSVEFVAGWTLGDGVRVRGFSDATSQAWIDHSGEVQGTPLFWDSVRSQTVMASPQALKELTILVDHGALALPSSEQPNVARLLGRLAYKSQTYGWPIEQHAADLLLAYVQRCVSVGWPSWHIEALATKAKLRTAQNVWLAQHGIEAPAELSRPADTYYDDSDSSD